MTSFAVIAIASAVLFLASSVGVGLMYQSTPEQIVERERVAAEKAERERLEAEEAARRKAEEAAQRESVGSAESKTQTPEPSDTIGNSLIIPSEPSPKAEQTAPDESENLVQPSYEENPIFEGCDSFAEKSLYTAPISECPVMNGIKTERIGSYERIVMSKDKRQLNTMWGRGRLEDVLSLKVWIMESANLRRILRFC